MIERESTVLPEPDSPTMPSVRPRSSVNDTPSTACTSAAVGLEVRRHVVDREQRRGCGRGVVGVGAGSVVGHRPPSRTSKWARTTSPRKFSASTVKKIMSAGSNTMCGATDEVAAPERDDVAPRRRVGALTPRRGCASVPSATIATAMPSSAIEIHRGQHVRQHLAEHDAPVLRALGLRREHELALRPRQRARARDPAEHRDRHDADAR